MTAAELTYFTCTGFFYDVESPLTSGSTNADQFNPISGAFVTFTPRVPAGFTVLISNLDLGSGNAGATAVALPPITGRVIYSGFEGQLCTINPSDTPGIKLLSNSSVISTYLTAQGIQSGQLIYDVTFTQVTYAGDNQTITPFAFAAPTDSTGVCITDPTFNRLPYVAP